MNDFTKDELEEMLSCVNNYTSECPKGYADLIYPELYSKIQSMIDSYCDHEWDEYFSSIRCGKCGYSEKTE